MRVIQRKVIKPQNESVETKNYKTKIEVKTDGFDDKFIEEMEDLGIEAKLVSSGEVLSKFNLDGPLEQLEFVLRSESYEVASNTPLVLGSEPQLETNESTQTKRWMNVELGC